MVSVNIGEGGGCVFVVFFILFVGYIEGDRNFRIIFVLDLFFDCCVFGIRGILCCLLKKWF